MLGAMNDAPPLTRDDFRRLTPLATAEAIPPPDRIWSDADWRLIGHGHKSADMDDKWNALAQGHRLYLHRSWTGRGIYEAEFAQVAGGWQIVAAVVEGFDVTVTGAPAAGAELTLSFEGGTLGLFAASSANGGAVIAARVPTSIFKSIGAFVPEARSISLVASAKPIWEVSTR